MFSETQKGSGFFMNYLNPISDLPVRTETHMHGHRQKKQKKILSHTHIPSTLSALRLSVAACCIFNVFFLSRLCMMNV